MNDQIRLKFQVAQSYLKLARAKTLQLYAASTQNLANRWAIFGLLFVTYFMRVFWLSPGWELTTYFVSIYLLTQFVDFLAPRDDPDLNGADAAAFLPNFGDDDPDAKPFYRRLPEYKFWQNCMVALLIAHASCSVWFTDWPVYWPLLVMYFLVVLVTTMQKRIRHMIKYHYLPFTMKKSWQHHTEAAPTADRDLSMTAASAPGGMPPSHMWAQPTAVLAPRGALPLNVSASSAFSPATVSANYPSESSSPPVHPPPPTTPVLPSPLPPSPPAVPEEASNIAGIVPLTQDRQMSSITRKNRLLCSAQQLGVQCDGVNNVASMSTPFQRLIEPAGHAFEDFFRDLNSGDFEPPQDEEDPPDNPIACFFAKLAEQQASSTAAPKKSARSSRTPPPSRPAPGSASSAGGPSASGSSAGGQHPPVYGTSFRSIIKDDFDLYEVLELGHVGELATPDEVRKAYRRLALKYHPDKLAPGSDDVDITKKFRQINEAVFTDLVSLFWMIVCTAAAFQVLSDPFLRRQYDSVQPFDDRVPTERQAAESVGMVFDDNGPSACPDMEGPALAKAWDGFSRLFDGVFRRNARWSVDRAVPPLGDLATTREDVEAFYSFWRTFRSWREFPSDEELNVEQASSRDERRWMERQNIRIRAKQRRTELQRISRLVDTASQYDPRLRRWQQEDEKARAEAAKARLAERLRVEAEERAAKQHDKELLERQQQAILAEQAQKKKEKKAQKADLRKARARLRAACQQMRSPAFDADSVEILCSELPVERLDALAQAVESLRAPAAAAATAAPAGPIDPTRVRQIEQEFRAEVDQQRERERAAQQSQEAQRAQEAQQRAAAQQAAAAAEESLPESGKPWSLDEVDLLNKAIKKYPAGTRQRWGLVAQNVRTRTEQQCIAKTRELATSGGHVSSSAALAQFLKYTHSDATAAAAAVTTVPAGANPGPLPKAPASAAPTPVVSPTPVILTPTATPSTAAAPHPKSPAPQPPPAPVSTAPVILTRATSTPGSKPPSPAPPPVSTTPTPVIITRAAAPAPAAKPTAPKQPPPQAARSPSASPASSPRLPAKPLPAPAKAAAAHPPAAPAGEAGGLGGPEWTAEEQRALELGLREFPASMGPERSECIERFKELARFFKQQQQAKAAAAAAKSS
ncbi:putative DnaJ subfamily C member 2 [Paratrimastix pyriformis]|uniref:DnaJ subfamily C member 2 n=1 Tax=Paratrimastix pyriformis TaxID=342808 RepID=A0ABQ8UIU4_9EUKA|nr:putative DnaJ subfamily C member 2 [Paratrimastix pyriformis]